MPLCHRDLENRLINANFSIPLDSPMNERLISTRKPLVFSQKQATDRPFLHHSIRPCQTPPNPRSATLGRPATLPRSNCGRLAVRANRTFQSRNVLQFSRRPTALAVIPSEVEESSRLAEILRFRIFRFSFSRFGALLPIPVLSQFHPISQFPRSLPPPVLSSVSRDISRFRHRLPRPTHVRFCSFHSFTHFLISPSAPAPFSRSAIQFLNHRSLLLPTF